MKKKIKHNNHVGWDLRKPWWGLYPIAARLNTLPELKGKVREAWRMAEFIISLMKEIQPEGNPAFVTRNRPEFAIEVFNGWAKKHPLPLTIRKSQGIPDRLDPVLFPQTKTQMKFAIWLLAHFFFSERGWQRLKKCPQCGIWFVDSSKNKCKERCSEKCTNKWWSWGRRKEAHHKL